MTALTLSMSRIRSGIWEGLLSGGAGARPEIEVIHAERPLPDVEVREAGETGGAWAARAPIPAEVLSDGIQTFLVRDKASGADIGSFTIMAGEAADADIRAEVELLRAELDMLKKAFRRHCLETSGR